MISSEIKTIPTNNPIGMYCSIFDFSKPVLKSSIITTNKKRTATAPTYTIINIIAKNSACKITKRPAALKKAKIRNKTEWTGFLDEITIKDESRITAEKI